MFYFYFVSVVVVLFREDTCSTVPCSSQIPIEYAGREHQEGGGGSAENAVE